LAVAGLTACEIGLAHDRRVPIRSKQERESETATHLFRLPRLCIAVLCRTSAPVTIAAAVAAMADADRQVVEAARMQALAGPAH
jgi:hypothetical protein